MAEYIRSIQIEIKIDTNKQTVVLRQRIPDLSQETMDRVREDAEKMLGL